MAPFLLSIDVLRIRNKDNLCSDSCLNTFPIYLCLENILRNVAFIYFECGKIITFAVNLKK